MAKDQAILAQLDVFRGEVAFQDDCTVLELTYAGAA